MVVKAPGPVGSLVEDRHSGRPIAVVRAAMTNQDGEVMATGQAEILLPAP